MSVNYISIPLANGGLVSVNTNTTLSQNDTFPASFGLPPDGVVNAFDGTPVFAIELTTADETQYILQSTDLTIKGYAPSSDDGVTRAWINGDTTTDIYGNSVVIQLTPGVEKITMNNSMQAEIADYNDPDIQVWNPPVSNKVLIYAWLNPQFPIGTQDVLISLDVDGDAKPIVMPFVEQEIIISAELVQYFGGTVDQSWYMNYWDDTYVSPYYSIEHVQEALDYVNNNTTTWYWELLDTFSSSQVDTTQIVRIKGTNLTGNPNTPVNILPFHAWFRIVPVEGQGISRLQMQPFWGLSYGNPGGMYGTLPLADITSPPLLTGINGNLGSDDLTISGGLGLWGQNGQQLPIVSPGYRMSRRINPRVFLDGWGGSVANQPISLSNLCGIIDEVPPNSNCDDCCGDSSWDLGSNPSACANIYFIDTNSEVPDFSENYSGTNYLNYLCETQYSAVNIFGFEQATENYIDQLVNNTVLVAWGENIGNLITAGGIIDEIRIKINCGWIVPDCLKEPPVTSSMPYNINISVPD